MALLLPLVGCQPSAPGAPGSASRGSASSGSGAPSSSSSAAPAPATGRAADQSPAPSAATGLTTAAEEFNSQRQALAARDEAARGAEPAAKSARRKVEQEKPTQDDAGGPPWLASSELPYEYWEAQYLNASRIGVTHYRVEAIGSQRLSITAKTTLQIQRGGQPVTQSVSIQTIEQANGEVDSFFENASGNETTAKAEGSVSNGALLLKTMNGQTAGSVSVHWPTGTWGPMGVQQLLLRKPMRSGERRQTHVFLPQIHKVAQVILSAGKEEDTPAPERTLTHLLPIDVLMQLEDQGVSSRIWTDQKGQVHKSVMMVGPNLSSYLVTREEAEQMQSQALVDVFAATAIKIDPPLVDADSARRIDYVVESKSADPFGLLSREANQSVRSQTAFRSSLTVWRPEAAGSPPPASGQSGPNQTRPAPECSAASPMIDSDDEQVAKMASALAGSESEPAALALKLTEGVFRAIRKKNFSRAFDSARDVARSLEGDCTEHAVLLAALLRNRGIPARIASGLIATESGGQTVFAYHMWTEAWVNDRWLPLDATQGSVAGCGHIKFLETALTESNPYSALLPVMSSLGQLTITVVKVTR